MSETPLHLIRTSRFVPASIERALNSAMSRGPGYEPTPIGPAFDDRSVRGYYIDFRAKTTAQSAEDTRTLLAVSLIQLALGWWERHASGDYGALERFLEIVAEIERRATSADGQLLWPIHAAAPKYRLPTGWPSALAQGQAASVFVRAHLATGEQRYADLARRAAAPFLDGPRAGLVTLTPAGPILEEAPSNPPSHVLNGWISASWGLWDIHVGLGDDEAAKRFSETISCLRALLPAYDTGWWTLYSLYPHAIQDLAKPIYHRFHTTQIEVLHRLTGYSDFAEARRRWASYDTPAARSVAVAQKAVFALADSSRRRRWARS